MHKRRAIRYYTGQAERSPHTSHSRRSSESILFRETLSAGGPNNLNKSQKMPDLFNTKMSPWNSTSSHRACGCTHRGMPGASFCDFITIGRISASYSSKAAERSCSCRRRAVARLYAPERANVVPMPDIGEAQYLDHYTSALKIRVQIGKGTVC